MAYTIKSPDPYSIIISENRFTSALNLLYTIGFFIVWYAGILSMGSMDKDTGLLDPVKNLFSMNLSDLWQSVQFIVSDMPFLLIFMLAPLFFVRSTIRKIRLVLVGNQLIIDGQSHAVFHNKQQVADFSDFERIEMDAEHSEGTKEYNLHAIKNGGEESFFLAKKSSHDDIFNLGQKISEITGVKFVQKKDKE